MSGGVVSGRDEIAEVLAAHASDMSDEQCIDGEWTWGICCDCGEFVPGAEVNTHLADALLASPALADLLATERQRGRDEALREAADEIRTSVSSGFGMRPDGSEDPLASAYVEGLRDAYQIVTDRAAALAPQDPA